MDVRRLMTRLQKLEGRRRATGTTGEITDEEWEALAILAHVVRPDQPGQRSRGPLTDAEYAAVQAELHRRHRQLEFSGGAAGRVEDP